MPDALPQSLRKGWETPHLGHSAKACQINRDLPSLSIPEIQVVSCECGVQVCSMWRVSSSRDECAHWMGSPADHSGVETGIGQYRGSLSAGCSIWDHHYAPLEPSSHGYTCCPDTREDFYVPALWMNQLMILPILNIPFSLITYALWNSVQHIKGKFAFEGLHASCMQTLLWFN